MVRQQVELISEEDGQRLDQFLVGRLSAFSRSEIQGWTANGDVSVNGAPAKASRRLKNGDVVRLLLPDDRSDSPQPWSTPLSVVYEDDDCAVIDKPAGLVMHPAPSHQQDTLVNALLARYPEMAAMVDRSGEPGKRPGIVHRLDKDTSGLVIIARHAGARLALQKQFQRREIDKAYLALLCGWLSPSEGVLAAPIGRDPRHRQRMAVRPEGREAQTRYRACRFLVPRAAQSLGRLQEHYTLTEAEPLTGRTHQIRVHMAHLGHPVVGDLVYGMRKRSLSCSRQFLHAHRLGFHRPSDGQWVTFDSPLPEDLMRVLSYLTDAS
jgi:23S rRNA pseudouridine1911/1915/1917 synthase